MAAITVEKLKLNTISANDVELVSVYFKQHLDNDELLTGTPTVSQPTNSTVANVGLNTTAFIDLFGETHPINTVVQCSFTSATAATYSLTVVATTDATIARTFNRLVEIIVQ